jgi:hypothetical protein
MVAYPAGIPPTRPPTAASGAQRPRRKADSPYAPTPRKTSARRLEVSRTPVGAENVLLTM